MRDWKQRLIQPTDSSFWQLVRYSISGGSSTVCDMLVLWLCTSVFGWHYQVGVFLGYITGLSITFTLSSFWIFTEHRLSNRFAELIGFALIGFLGMASTHLVMWLMTEVVMNEEYYMVSKVVAVAVVALQNFVLRKFILYKK